MLQRQDRPPKARPARALPAPPQGGRLNLADLLPRRNTAMVRGLFSFAAALTDICAIMATATLSGVIYHLALYGDYGPVEAFQQVGFIICLLVLAPNAARDEYAIGNYLALKGHFSRSFMLWNIAFLSALAIGFLTKTSGIFSRGSVLAFYVAGFAALLGGRALLVRTVKRLGREGRVSARRIFLVGPEAELHAFTARYQPWKMGIQIVASAVLREAPENLGDDLALAAASARVLTPDDVFILVPWSRQAVIASAVDAFMRVPAAIHLGPERALERFQDVHISRIGPINSLYLVRKPLTIVEIIEKRAFDFAGALLALILLSPAFALIAALIRLDSPGPVFFTQRRYGFNQQPFQIFKFRSMKISGEGGAFRQAADGDERFTRVGKILRRANLDELPQLINVLRGDMSLVGPRPHALAHDQQFESRIALYARRHNVMPGITGWAQVNGFRGDTGTDGKMQSRVTHDLYYIDHWSLWLDMRILWLTVFSRKAYRNAL